MTKKVYVGNLSFSATEDQVRGLFEEYGEIQSIAMINDRDTGRFRGFAFVEMEDSAANAAIKALNGKEVDGRELSANEARPREERSGGGSYGGGNRSGGSGYGGGNRSGGSGYGGNRSGGSGGYSGGGDRNRNRNSW